MAKNKSGVRLCCRAVDYLHPASIPELSTLAEVQQHLLSSPSRSPIRGAVEARSDMGFAQQVIDGLGAHGLGTNTAHSVAAAVLAHPTLATQRRDGPHPSILQSLVVPRETEDDLDMQVVVRAVGLGGKPPSVALTDVSVVLTDLDDEVERLVLIACVEDWTREFPLPSAVHPHPLALPTWAWLGDPTWAGVLEVPQDWRERVLALGDVYGRRPLIAETARAAQQYKLGERAGFVVATQAVGWAENLNGRDAPREEQSYEIEIIGQKAPTFGAVLLEVRRLLHSRVAASMATVPGSRDLNAGEIIYHRKVGESRKYDNFDAGTTKACMHGSGSFVPWHGDKARKGMARRYTNFNNSMLIHCRKYPACHVYGVDASRGGLKA